MKKSRVKTDTVCFCGECTTFVDRCDTCKRPFGLTESLYCNDSQAHLCEACAVKSPYKVPNEAKEPTRPLLVANVAGSPGFVKL